MKPITAIAPTIGNYTQTAINVVNQVESSFNRYKKMVDDFRDKNIYKNKRQETVVAILNQILQQRVPVNLSGLRFNYNPFLLEEEFDIINSFEEDCMFPTKYIVRNINDVEYVKKIVNRIKK